MPQLLRPGFRRKLGYKIHCPACRHTATGTFNAGRHPRGKTTPQGPDCIGGSGGGFCVGAAHADRTL